MKINRGVSGFGKLKLIVALAGILAVITGEMWMARRYGCGGSSITNPGAFASEQLATGLRLVSR